MSAPSRLHDLVALAHEPSSARRRELLRRVTDVFLDEQPSAEGAKPFDPVMCALAADVEEDVRAELSARFAHAPAAPAELAARLAQDCIRVALPILRNTRLLSEADLLKIVRTKGQDHLRAVSARAGLSEAVSEVIVARGDDETLGVLARNESAALSREASEAVVARATGSPKLQAALVGRANLPLDLVNSLYLVVEERLREGIRARNAAASPALIEAALGAARARMASRPPDPAELEAADAEARGLQGRRRLTGPALVGFLRSGRRLQFCAGLACLAEVDTATATSVVDRADLDALAILCKACDLDRGLFLTFALLLCGDRDGLKHAPTYARLYTELTPDVAQRTLRFWRVRAETLQAAA